MKPDAERLHSSYVNNSWASSRTKTSNSLSKQIRVTGFISLSMTRANYIQSRYTVIVPGLNNEVLYDVGVLDGSCSLQMNGVGIKQPRLQPGQPVVIEYFGNSRTPLIVGTIPLERGQKDALEQGDTRLPNSDLPVYGSYSYSSNAPSSACGKFTGRSIITPQPPWRLMPTGLEEYNTEEAQVAPTAAAMPSTYQVDDGQATFNSYRHYVQGQNNAIFTTDGSYYSMSESKSRSVKIEYDVTKVELAHYNNSAISYVNGVPWLGKQEDPKGLASYTFPTVVDLEADFVTRTTTASQITTDLTNWLTTDLLGFILNISGLWGILNQEFGLSDLGDIPIFDESFLEWGDLGIGVPIVDDLINAYVPVIIDALVGAFQGFVAVFFTALSNAAWGLGSLIGIGVDMLTDLLLGGKLTLMSVITRVLEIEDDFLPGPVSFGSLLGSLADIFVSFAINALTNAFEGFLLTLFEDESMEADLPVPSYYEVPAIHVKSDLNTTQAYYYPHHHIAKLMTMSGVAEAGLIVQSVYDLVRTDSVEAYLKALVPVVDVEDQLIFTSAISYYFDEVDTAQRILKDVLFSSGGVSCNLDITDKLDKARKSGSSKSVVDELKDYFFIENIPYFEEIIEQPKKVVDYLVGKNSKGGKAADLLYNRRTFDFLDEVTRVKTGDSLFYHPRVRTQFSKKHIYLDNSIGIGYE